MLLVHPSDYARSHHLNPSVEDLYPIFPCQISSLIIHNFRVLSNTQTRWGREARIVMHAEAIWPIAGQVPHSMNFSSIHCKQPVSTHLGSLLPTPDHLPTA